MRDRQVNRESAGGEADSYFCRIGTLTASRTEQAPAQIALCRHDVAEPFQIFFD